MASMKARVSARLRWCSFAALAILFATTGTLRAELAWEKPRIAIEAIPGQTEAVAIFKFTNRGAKPVRIVGVDANCGCTVAKPAKSIFAAGESGELPASMTLAGADRTVAIQVKTDEQGETTYGLTFHVSQIHAPQLSPRLVFWNVGEKPMAKKAVIKVQAGLKVLGAEVVGGGFSAKVELAKNGEVIVWITPNRTDAKAQAALTVTAQLGDRPPADIKGFLRVL